ncbi:MAG TPA: hypothetical protein VFY23_09835 [Candidatus Limnocylindrales bacterium]|nr:hypothetical protein [Candidatus Limnocylindrales bacterium]
MERSTTSPDALIASLPDGVREDMARLDAVIAQGMAGRERVLWEGVFWGGTEQRIIGYGRYAGASRSGTEVDWFLLGLARQKDHFSVYCNAVQDGAYLVKALGPDLGKVKVGSANITFRRAADIDLGKLRALVDAAAATSPEG